LLVVVSVVVLYLQCIMVVYGQETIVEFPLRFPLQYSTLVFEDRSPAFRVEINAPADSRAYYPPISTQWDRTMLIDPLELDGLDHLLINLKDSLLRWTVAVGPDSRDESGIQVSFTAKPPKIVNFTTGNETIVITYHIFTSAGETYRLQNRYLTQGTGICNFFVPASGFFATVLYTGYNFTQNRHITTTLDQTYAFDAVDFTGPVISGPSTTNKQACFQSQYTWKIDNPFDQSGGNITDLSFTITTPEIDTADQNTVLSITAESQKSAEIVLDQSDMIEHGIAFQLDTYIDAQAVVTSWKETLMWIMVVVILVIGGICGVFICLINWLDQKVQVADKKLQETRAKVANFEAEDGRTN